MADSDAPAPASADVTSVPEHSHLDDTLGLSPRVAEHDGRLDGHDGRLDDHGGKLDSHGHQLDAHDGKLSDHDKQLAELHGAVFPEHEDHPLHDDHDNSPSKITIPGRGQNRAVVSPGGQNVANALKAGQP